MRLINNKLLAQFRMPGRCEVCKRYCRKREPHHVSARGMGSANRCDHPYNLLALGSSELFVCDCHHRAHTGELCRAYLLGLISLREGVTVTVLEAEVKRLQHQSKEERRREQEATRARVREERKLKRRAERNGKVTKKEP